MDYQSLVVKTHNRPSTSKHTAESRYWRQFKHPVFVKEYAPITSVHFSPSKPHRYAVTAATRVQIYAPRTQKLTKTISRFKDVARSGCIRGDGKLVVAGDDSGLIQIFDINSRAILRTLDSHKQPVHVTKFSSLSPTHVLSCSDDTTVKLWDVPSQTAVTTFTEHTDYVRAGQISTANHNIILTGSYDGTVRLFDARSGLSEMVMATGDRQEHSDIAPVEQVLMFPSGTVALSTSGPILRVWDIVAGGRCTRALSNHQKTVTALTFNANSDRLLTGSLDQMVKVYDVSTYKVVHTMRYPSPVLCLAISPDDTHILGGMSDGTLSIRRRDPKASEIVQSDQTRLDAPALLHDINIGHGLQHQKLPIKPLMDSSELRVQSQSTRKLKEYDKLLKSFKYSAALDSVLKKNVPPTVTFSLIQELIHRDGLRIALAGRDDVLLEPILRLLSKYISDPRFGELAADVTGLVIDMYTSVIGQAPLIDALFLRLRKKVAAELRFQEEIVRAKGALTMILSSAITPAAR
ncbi:U3 small nucleolar RNA-associated protein 15 [Psilocybe cubensis]|uniref:U3 small nucleolar RNA-associated protein 15 n=2 Tax=Psilocybe cubensis TaxID=181762 RepID=A0ACB8H5D3_PSICU|nr:U3 small nucleolar RNA-associated protein 15 [Psilocybe cubensis]KAH9482696.1 U3 small nucleolar RNA-associated protein 15 [Psilocybe cubensis]